MILLLYRLLSMSIIALFDSTPVCGWLNNRRLNHTTLIIGARQMLMPAVFRSSSRSDWYVRRKHPHGIA